jgi:hypothetical protein
LESQKKEISSINKSLEYELDNIQEAIMLIKKEQDKHSEHYRKNIQLKEDYERKNVEIFEEV